MAKVNGSPPNQAGGSSYITIAVGLITAGTILVSVVVAAYAALALQKMNNFDTGFGQLGVMGAVSSVSAYVLCVFCGLAALVRPTAPLRSSAILSAVNMFFSQALSAGALAFAVMVGPLFTGNFLSPDSEQRPTIQNASYHDLLNDARFSHARAIERLEHGHVRESAGLAWLATLKATDAILSMRTEHSASDVASRGSSLNALAKDDPRVESLAERYQEQASRLHDECFYNGFCDFEITDLIRSTDQYINDAARVGAAQTLPE